MKIRLSEEDAERLGCPRDLEFDFEKLMGRELMALEEQVGWSFDEFAQKMQGEPLKNALGEPVWETDDKGKVVLDAGGKPMRARGLRIAQLMVMTWLCVFRTNPDVTWKGFDFNVVGTEFVDEEEPGKGGTTSAASPKNTTGTKPRLRTPSRSRRGSSATA
jgi:hypothetical protein